MKFLFRRRPNSTETPAPAPAAPIDEWIAEGNRLEDGGDVEHARQLHERAVEAFEKALALDASHPMAAAMLARLLLGQGDADESAHVIDAALLLRATLPDRMRASALMDGPRFARDVETIFRNAWAARCTPTP